MSQQQPKFRLKTVLLCSAITIVIVAIAYPFLEQYLPKTGDKRSNCLSNIKQLSMAMELYASDFDERYPFALTPDFNQNRWRTLEKYSPDNLIEFPVGWRKSQNDDRYVENQLGWPNALYEYVNSTGIYTCFRSDRIRRTSQPRGEGGELSDYSQKSDRGKTPSLVSYTFNGLLHTYPQKDITDPSECILLWEGTGKVEVEGFAISNPQILCEKLTDPCIYKPYKGHGNCPITNTEAPSAMLFGTSRNSLMPGGSMFVHTSGLNVAYADTHAKWTRTGNFSQKGRFDPGVFERSPFAVYDDAGFPLEYATDGCWPVRFRPDNPSSMSDTPR